METKIRVSLKLAILFFAFGAVADAGEIETPIQVGDAFNFTSAYDGAASGRRAPPALHGREYGTFMLNGSSNEPLSPREPSNVSSRIGFLSCGMEKLTIDGRRISKDAVHDGREAYTSDLFVTKVEGARNPRVYEVFVDRKRYSSDAALASFLAQEGYERAGDTGGRVILRPKTSRVSAPPATHRYLLRSSDFSVKTDLTCYAWITLHVKAATATQDFIAEFKAATSLLKAGLQARDFNSLTTRLGNGAVLNHPPTRENQLAISGDLILAPR